MGRPTEVELKQLEERWAELRERYVLPVGQRPPTPGRAAG